MNRKNLTAAVLAGLAGIAGVASTAQAVNLNPDGLGEVLIYPYYTVNDGNQTLMTVVNTTGDAKAAKVRFLEGHNSREVLDFNLYLSEYDVWVAAIADGGDLGFAEQAGVPHLVIPDTSCTVPYLYGNGIDAGLDFGLQAFLPYAYTGDFEDGGPTGIARASEGYIHIVEMGVLTNGDEVDKDELEDDVGKHAARIGSADAATHVVKEDDDGNEYVEPEDCGQLVENWTRYVGNVTKPHPLAGWWAEDSDKCKFDEDDDPLSNGCDQADPVYFPESGVWLSSTSTNAGGLFGNGAVINVAKGTMFSYDAKAVQGFDDTDDGVHFEPGTIHPGMNDGSVLDAYVANDNGIDPPSVDLYTYERGADAMSAVFMHDTLANTFTIEEGLAAATEWVLTFPTKLWYADPARLGAFTFYTPDPDDTGCNGWDPGEPNPYTLPVYQGTGSNWKPGDPIPDGTNTNPATGEDWSTCTPIKASTQNSAINPFTSRFDGEACEEVSLRVWDREESPTVEGGNIIPPIVSPAPPGTAPPGETPFELCYEVNVLRFGDVSVFGTESDLLLEVTNTPDNGWGRITFGGPDGEGNCVACDDDDIEQHQDSNGLRGLPVTGFAAEQYVNGTLEGGSVLANYGGLFSHKGSVLAESCTLGSEVCAGRVFTQ